MGCTDTKVAPVSVHFVSLSTSKLKCATHKEDIRDMYSVKRPISFNSTTGLFVGAEETTPNQHVYVRYARLNKSIMDPLSRRFDGLFAKKPELTNLLLPDAIGQTQYFLYLAMKAPRHTRGLQHAIISGSFVLNESNLCLAFCPIFSTMLKMHEIGIPHGQINPDKFLIIKGGCYLFDVCIGNESAGDRLAENFRFLAPEELNGEGPSPESDVWALGATLYYLITGHAVYPGTSAADFRAYAASREPSFEDPIWTILSASLKDVVEKMLARDKHVRASMRQVVDSFWAQGAEIGRHDALIDNNASLVADVKRRACLHKAMYALANDRPPRMINEFLNKMRMLDYNGSNSRYMEYGTILETALGENVVKCEDCDFFWAERINYESFMSDVNFLNALINHERLSILFYQLSHNREYVTDMDIKRAFECGVAHKMYTAPGVLEELIRAHQKTPRLAPLLYYVEFVEMCQYINFAPKEGLIMGKFFEYEAPMGGSPQLKDPAKKR